MAEPTQLARGGPSRTRAFGWIWIAYLAALAVGITGTMIIADPVADHALYLAGIADVLATVVIFAFSVIFRNSSFYDPYWSVVPPALGLYWWLVAGAVDDPRIWLAMLIVSCWAVRLTYNWAFGWTGLDHEDWRYRDLQNKLGLLYWPVSFLGIHLLPTALVFLGCVPLFLIMGREATALNGIDLLALAVGLAAVWIETRADIELHRFRARRGSPAEALTTGVWGWCRHPNYLGEIGFWLSLGLFAWAAGADPLWCFAGFLAMVALFEVVSIPMIEEKLLAAKPGYEAYRRSTFRLLPLSVLKRTG